MTFKKQVFVRLHDQSDSFKFDQLFLKQKQPNRLTIKRKR